MAEAYVHPWGECWGRKHTLQRTKDLWFVDLGLQYGLGKDEPVASGKCGLRIRLRAEPEAAPGDRDRLDTHIVLLQRRRPRHQLRSLRLCHLVMATHHAGDSFHDNAPPLRGVMVVDLEKNVVVDGRADQFGPFRGSKQHRAVLHNKVDGENLRLAVHAGDKAP